VFEGRLIEFLENQVPCIHASHIRAALPGYIPLMKQFPEVAAPRIQRFRHYLTEAPQDNVIHALACLGAIAAQVPELRDQIAHEIGDVLDEFLLVPGLLEESTVVALKAALEVPVSAHDRFVRDLSRKVITLGQPMILVIGAGFSYDVMPITGELAPLLIATLRNLGVEDPARLLQTDDKAAWEIISRHAADFQKAFVGWCAARSKPAVQHIVAAEMLRAGEICHLVSFNWDSLIERAYADQFGEAIPKITTDGVVPDRPSLWKMHGDVENPAEPWVFPYGPGTVFDTLMESLEESVKDKTPACALIVGYSESESEVKAKLIRWLERHVATILRVRPDWQTGQGGLADSANRFFRRLVGQMALDRRQKVQ
jgi:hypothetical protein